MSVAPILVTGAAGGRQGSTGRHVVRLLRERGVPVRALVRRDDERVGALRTLGADVVVGDLLDRASVRRAVSGVARAYFAYPVQEGLLEATATFAAAARETGVERVVNLSQFLTPDGDLPTPHQNRHWLAERVFDWAGIGVVHLDATVFYENLRALSRGSLAAANVLLLPWGPESTTIPMVSAENVARVAAGALVGPAMPNGTVLPLVGDVLTLREIVDAFAEALGRPVRYREIDDDEWVRRVSGAGLNAVALEHLTNLWRYLRTRSAPEQAAYRVSDEIERVGGAPRTTLRAFLRAERDSFAAAAA
jgi:uncharacterized protein YbjT (DUF2867 family)